MLQMIHTSNKSVMLVASLVYLQFIPYFQQKCDACGIFGLSSIHKCIVALKILTYSVNTNACGVYCRLGKSIVMEALKRFCKVVRECFETKNLWQPSKGDTLTNNYKSMLIMATKGCLQACIICIMCGKFANVLANINSMILS
jgi:hypothetical protein